MPLPLPNLDDRRWTDLVEEARALIPLYAPEWTDHNASDPGITFIELFAWLAEMNLYELNQIPEQHRRKFLALVGIRPEPPRAARTVVRFVLKAGNPPLPLPAGAEFEGNDPFGAVTRFRTLDSVLVLPIAIRALKYNDTFGFHELTHIWQRSRAAEIFGNDPRPGAAFYIGLDAPLPPATQAGFYLSFEGEQAGDAERQRLIDDYRRCLEPCHAPDSLLNCDKPAPRPEPPPVTPPHHCARTAWEFYAGAEGWRRLEPRLGEIEDDTRSLTLNGAVKMRLPSPISPRKLGEDTQDYFYLRCVFTGGAFDAAPQLRDIAVNGVAAEQAVHPDALESVPHNAGNLEGEVLGHGSGLPRQQLTTRNHPVLQSTFRLFTIEQNILHEWELRQDFDASNARDRHFRLDPTSGQVRFGNGAHGRVAPAAAPIVAIYLTTRAEAGNLAADKVQRLALSAWNRRLLERPALGDYPGFDAVSGGIAEIHNQPATGGAAAETLSHAEGRAAAAIDATTRAVTASDFQRLALQTPGARLARAAVKANMHPAFPCFAAPGMALVLVVPFLPAAKPSPSSGLLRAVSRYLQPKRVVGTRIEVVGPTYVEVVVEAEVKARPGSNTALLRQRIVSELNGFFHPLTGGPEGSGWPFGRDVYRSEVLKRIANLDGVDHVVSVSLFARGATEPQCGNICLGPAELVVPGQHRIEVNA